MTVATKDIIQDWLTIEEVAARVERSRSMVKIWIVEHKIEFVEKGKRQYLIYWPSVVEFRASMAKKKTAPISQSSP